MVLYECQCLAKLQRNKLANFYELQILLGITDRIMPIFITFTKKGKFWVIIYIVNYIRDTTFVSFFLAIYK